MRHLALLSLLTFAACVRVAPVAPELRNADARTVSVVRIDAYCGKWSSRSGSGVIVSQRHVLTAAHLVGCADLPRVNVTFLDARGEERRLRMVVTAEDADTDIAKLEIASAEQFGIALDPPVVRAPNPGEHACANLAHADAIACGTVASTWTAVRRMETDAVDAGAPVYCDRGTLVGIVVGRGSGGGERYAWIAPIEKRWLAGIVPAGPPVADVSTVASF